MPPRRKRPKPFQKPMSPPLTRERDRPLLHASNNSDRATRRKITSHDWPSHFRARSHQPRAGEYHKGDHPGCDREPSFRGGKGCRRCPGDRGERFRQRRQARGTSAGGESGCAWPGCGTRAGWRSPRLPRQQCRPPQSNAKENAASASGSRNGTNTSAMIARPRPWRARSHGSAREPSPPDRMRPHRRSPARRARPRAGRPPSPAPARAAARRRGPWPKLFQSSKAGGTRYRSCISVCDTSHGSRRSRTHSFCRSARSGGTAAKDQGSALLPMPECDTGCSDHVLAKSRENTITANTTSRQACAENDSQRARVAERGTRRPPERAVDGRRELGRAHPIAAPKRSREIVPVRENGRDLETDDEGRPDHGCNDLRHQPRASRADRAGQRHRQRHRQGRADQPHGCDHAVGREPARAAEERENIDERRRQGEGRAVRWISPTPRCAPRTPAACRSATTGSVQNPIAHRTRASPTPSPATTSPRTPTAGCRSLRATSPCRVAHRRWRRHATSTTRTDACRRQTR